MITLTYSTLCISYSSCLRRWSAAHFHLLLCRACLASHTQCCNGPHLLGTGAKRQKLAAAAAATLAPRRCDAYPAAVHHGDDTHILTPSEYSHVAEHCSVDKLASDWNLFFNTPIVASSSTAGSPPSLLPSPRLESEPPLAYLQSLGQPAVAPGDPRAGLDGAAPLGGAAGSVAPDIDDPIAKNCTSKGDCDGLSAVALACGDEMSAPPHANLYSAVQRCNCSL